MSLSSPEMKGAKQRVANHNVQIEKIEAENRTLLQELSLEKHYSKAASGGMALKEIERLQKQGDQFTRKIEQEKRRMRELDKKREKLQQKLQEQRKKMGGINASRDNNKNIAKQIRILEGRLDKALMKYNETLANNTALREKIDGLRQARVVFDGIYKK